MTAQTRSEIESLLRRHGVVPRRRLGQHFLADANITRRIVAASGVGSGDRVVEVGAGTGTLTRALAATGAHVIAYEVDERLRPILGDLAGPSVELRFEDITHVDLDASFPDGQWVMVANLPYNVGTPLVMDVLRLAPHIVKMTVMVQKEVADRLVALPNDPAYGLPSVVTRLFSRPSLLMRVPPQVFYPRPKVESAVVSLERVPAPASAERAVELARVGFSQRRKMLRSVMSEVFADPVEALTAAGIDPTSRAETLDASDFLRLAAI